MASNEGLSVTAVVMSIIAVSIGVVLIGSLLSPLAYDVMTDLSTNYGSDGASWSSLVGVVVIMSILGLIIVAVNTYTKK